MSVIVSVIGARPQFIKAAPIELAFAETNAVQHYSIHTGQHYDQNMSQVFFDGLGLTRPYANLQAGGGTHAEQTAAMMLGLEPILMELKPDLLVVYGDTNSTIAAGLVAAKLNIPVAHIEAGLRSYNREMPEEVNRLLTDHLSTLLYAPTDVAMENLRKEGIVNACISGDVMLDMIQIAMSKNVVQSKGHSDYYYVTLHRPYNTDKQERMLEILNALNGLDLPAIFSLHPRTAGLLKEKYNIRLEEYPNITFIEPQGYFENLGYLSGAAAVITDSGGMQKEAYFLQKKCVTIRSETEWIETLENNCNTLVWKNINDLKKIVEANCGEFHSGIYGNGNAAKIIVADILKYLENK